MTRAAAALLLAGLVLAGCRKAADTTTSKRITVATSQEPDVLIPAFAESTGAHQVVESGWRYLTTYTPAWKVAPALATRVPSLANGGVVLLDAAGAPVKDAAQAQGMKVTWNLQPGATWMDGTPVTSGDFTFAQDVLKDPRQEVRDRTLLDKVLRMEAPDAHTLVVTWKEPYAFFQGYRNHHLLPRHLLEQVWKPAGAAETVSLKAAAQARQPALFGPFQMQAWKPGEFIQLVRNPKAFLPPVLDGITWQFFAGEAQAVAALEAGTVDAIAPDGTVGVDAVLQLLERRPGAFEASFHPGMTWAHMDVNLEDPWLKDVRLREALLLAMDRTTAVERVFKGHYQVAHGLFPPQHDGHHAGLKQREFNPQAARTLLDQLGWALPPDGKGVRHNAQGEALHLEIAYATGQKSAVDLLTAFQSNLADVGVDVELKGMPPKVFFGEVLRKRGARHLAFYAWTMDPQAYAESLLASSKIPSQDNGWEGQNYVGYRNPAVDALITAIPRTLDDAARAALLRKLNDAFVQDLPMLPIYTRPVVSVARKGVAHWEPTGTQTPVSWNAEQWSLP